MHISIPKRNTTSVMVEITGWTLVIGWGVIGWGVMGWGVIGWGVIGWGWRVHHNSIRVEERKTSFDISLYWGTESFRIATMAVCTCTITQNHIRSILFGVGECRNGSDGDDEWCSITDVEDNGEYYIMNALCICINWGWLLHLLGRRATKNSNFLVVRPHIILQFYWSRALELWNGRALVQ